MENNQERGVREAGRELAFLTLFYYDQNRMDLQELCRFNWFDGVRSFFDEDGALSFVPEKKEKETFQYAGQLVQGTVSMMDKVDDIISAHLVKWDFSRLRSVDKAILRLSVYTILYEPEVPSEVIISEANILAENYGEDNAPRYINGMLHKIKEKYRNNASGETEAPKKLKIVRKKPAGN